jgi:hypothetical protein
MHRRSGISRPPRLFHSAGIFDVIEDGKAQVKELVQRLSTSEIESEGIAERVIAPLLLAIPVLDEAGKYAESREIDVDVSGDPMRMIFDRSQPFYIKGKAWGSPLNGIATVISVQVAQSLIAQRKQQATAHAQIVGGLGIPIRQTQPSPTQNAAQTPVTRQTTSRNPLFSPWVTAPSREAASK